MKLPSSYFVRSAVFMAVALSVALFAQPGQAPEQPANAFPSGDNQWHLGYSVKAFDSNGVFHDVATRQMGDQSANHPMEVNEMWEAPSGKKAVLLSPPVDCVNTGPASTNACVFTASSALQVDANHIRFSYRNWGGRCQLSVRVMEYDSIAQWKWADLSPWSTGSSFIVVVPEEAAPDSAEVFGKLNGANIYLTPSDPLSAADQEHFKLLEPKRFVHGLGTIYRFQARS